MFTRAKESRKIILRKKEMTNSGTILYPDKNLYFWNFLN